MYGEVAPRPERVRKGMSEPTAAPYIEYDPDTETYCGACRSVIPIHGPHLCANPAVRYEPPTLRDQFAMAALTGLWSTCVQGEPLDTRRCASLCYKQADAMMIARDDKR